MTCAQLLQPIPGSYLTTTTILILFGKKVSSFCRHLIQCVCVCSFTPKNGTHVIHAQDTWSCYSTLWMTGMCTTNCTVRRRAIAANPISFLYVCSFRVPAAQSLFVYKCFKSHTYRTTTNSSYVHSNCTAGIVNACPLRAGFPAAVPFPFHTLEHTPSKLGTYWQLYAGLSFDTILIS